jgi:hypothetical protein
MPKGWATWKKVAHWPGCIPQEYSVQKVSGGYFLRKDEDIGRFIPTRVYKAMVLQHKIISAKKAAAIEHAQGHALGAG